MNDRTTLDGPVAVASLLLFVQGAVAVALSAEAVGAAVLFGGLPAFGAALTVGGAATTLVLVRRIEHRHRSTRRWIIALQAGWIALGAFDLVLALALAGRGLTPVGFTVRMALPVAIVWLLRRPAARAEFGMVDTAAGEARHELVETPA